MFDFKKIDEFLQRCESAPNDQALRKVFSLFQAEYDLSIQDDPFSETYRAKQLDIYKQLAGKSYSVKNEVTAFDVAAASIAPFPYVHGSSDLVGNQLMSIGYLIKTMGLPKNAKVLEFGPGWGNTTIALAKMGFDVTAVDIEKNFCNLISERARLEGLKINVVESDFSHINSIQEQFDAVLFFECFHHCSNHLGLMAAFDRVVKPGGLVCFGAEPILPDFPVPWGLRMDGESVWAIRRNGWLELGFNEEYFEEAMCRHGWALNTYKSSDVPGMSSIIAKRISELGGSYSLNSGLQTQVGVSTPSGMIQTTAKSGYLVHGPYISLPKGKYKAQFTLDAGAPASGLVEMDVVVAMGSRVMAKKVFDLSRPSKPSMGVDFVLDKSEQGIEIRLKCDEATQLTVASLEMAVQ
jgi:2-polyprenyl-3-methyl-5-hydroxy-6-metoxy-1,4-benzoquinol methylase